jgi:hypothetical protein
MNGSKTNPPPHTTTHFVNGSELNHEINFLPGSIPGDRIKILFFSSFTIDSPTSVF